MLHSGGAFSRYIIASPSLWNDARAAFGLEATYAETHEDLPAKAFFSVGLLESDGSSPPFGSGRMISNLRDLIEVFGQRNYSDFDWGVHFFEEETHQSVIGPSISRGLRFIYSN